MFAAWASSTLVTADFNGDGRQDYGGLLRLNYTGNETPWQGKVLREAQFSLVIFLRETDGTLKAQPARSFISDIPVATVIEVEPAGPVDNRMTNTDIRLTHPGILFSYCEKSAAVYYVSGDRIRSIPVSD